MFNIKRDSVLYFNKVQVKPVIRSARNAQETAIVVSMASILPAKSVYRAYLLAVRHVLLTVVVTHAKLNTF